MPYLSCLTGILRRCLVFVVKVTRDAIYIVKALVVEHTPALRVLFGLPSIRLVRPKLALHVHLCHLGEPLKPSYQMAAIYVAMVSLMTGRRPWPDVAVLGSVSNAGSLGSMWEWTAKSFEFCHSRGIRRVVLAATTTVRALIVPVWGASLLARGDGDVKYGDELMVMFPTLRSERRRGERPWSWTPTTVRKLSFSSLRLLWRRCHCSSRACQKKPTECQMGLMGSQSH